MSKYTLLQMVQKVGRAINSDEIDALGETIEADDIQNILMDTLRDIMIRRDWEFLKDKPATLLAGANAISLSIPTTVRHVQNVRYRTEQDGVVSRYTTLKYMRPDDFICMLQRNSAADPAVTTITVNGVELFAQTNRPPRYWTTFDETNIYMDSYDSSIDPTGLDHTKSVILATLYLDYTGSDAATWVAPIPEVLFQQWLQEAIADASVTLRQIENPRAERKARRLFVSNGRDEPVTHRDASQEIVNYGR